MYQMVQLWTRAFPVWAKILARAHGRIAAAQTGIVNDRHVTEVKAYEDYCHERFEHQGVCFGGNLQREARLCSHKAGAQGDELHDVAPGSGGARAAARRMTSAPMKQGE
jgi:hypothetical protein